MIRRGLDYRDIDRIYENGFYVSEQPNTGITIIRPQGKPYLNRWYAPHSLEDIYAKITAFKLGVPWNGKSRETL